MTGNEDNSHTLQAGVIFDKYRIIRHLASSGMSDVYFAEHLLLGGEYALKVMKDFSGVKQAVNSKRFLQEARCFHKLDHPNIVRVFDSGCDSKDGKLFIAMEYLSGGSLADVPRRIFPAEELLKIAGDIAGALVELDRHHIVHRDIKPSNIMIGSDGQYKLMDLGIAKSHDAGDNTLTIDYSVFGTPAFASPEQCQSPHNVDSRSDIYSLGVTLYVLACGKQPYEGETPVQTIVNVISHTAPPLGKIRSGLPQPVEELIRSMMEKSPHKRPQSAAVLQSMIASVSRSLVRGDERKRKKQLFRRVIFTGIFAATAAVLAWDLYFYPVRITLPESRKRQPVKVVSAASVVKNVPPPVVKNAPPPVVKKVQTAKSAAQSENSITERKCHFKPADPGKIRDLIHHMLEKHSGTTGWKTAPGKWHNHFAHAAEKARESRKMLLIFTSRAMLFPAFMLDRKYVEALEKDFVLMFCDCDQQEMPIAQKRHLGTVFRLLNIRTYPSTVVLSSDWKHLTTIPSVNNHRPEIYREILSAVKTGQNVHFDSKNHYIRDVPGMVRVTRK